MTALNTVQLADAADLARCAGRAYAHAVAYYQRQLGVSATEADALAREPLWHITEAPSHDVSWFGLQSILHTDPALAAVVWERIKADALVYVEGGQNVADALKYHTPWERAQFFAVRQALYDAWPGPNGIERMLIDQLAHAHCMCLYWSGVMQERATASAVESPIDAARRKEGYWVAPRVSEVEAIDQAMQMVDRFNRLLVRTL